ncbi:TPA: hypothetical protein HA265_06485 [Candidatus Woesearchaeota archaeon]|nr:hypothetical protein [Candidatus Woesearchaeota archaeon]
MPRRSDDFLPPGPISVSARKDIAWTDPEGLVSKVRGKTVKAAKSMFPDRETRYVGLLKQDHDPDTKLYFDSLYLIGVDPRNEPPVTLRSVIESTTLERRLVMVDKAPRIMTHDITLRDAEMFIRTFGYTDGNGVFFSEVKRFDPKTFIQHLAGHLKVVPLTVGRRRLFTEYQAARISEYVKEQADASGYRLVMSESYAVSIDPGEALSQVVRRQ